MSPNNERRIWGNALAASPRDSGGPRRAAGQVVVLGALFMVALMGIIALAVDVGYAYLQQRQVQNYSDSLASAASAALLQYEQNGKVPTDAQVTRVVSATMQQAGLAPNSWVLDTSSSPRSATPPSGLTAFQAQYVYFARTGSGDVITPTGVLVGSGTPVPVVPVAGGVAPANEVQVTYAWARVPAFFGRVLGRQNFEVRAQGDAKYYQAPPTSETPAVPMPSSTATSPSLPTATPVPPMAYCYTIPGLPVTGYKSSTPIAATLPSAAAAGWPIVGNMLFETASGGGGQTSTATMSLISSTQTLATASSIAGSIYIPLAPPLTYTSPTSATFNIAISASTGNSSGTDIYSATVQYFTYDTSLPASTCSVPATPTPSATPTTGPPTATPTPSVTTLPIQNYQGGPFYPFMVWGGNTAPFVKGQDLNFWGAEWSKQVHQGNFAANASFKGYSDTLPATLATPVPGGAAPICVPPGGLTPTPTSSSCWATDPGNSVQHMGTSQPPASLPAGTIIDVGVTTFIQRVSGAQPPDYGNIVAVVAVQVDPGYGTASGLAGWGTVLCYVWTSPNVPAIPAADPLNPNPNALQQCTS